MNDIDIRFGPKWNRNDQHGIFRLCSSPPHLFVRLSWPYNAEGLLFGREEAEVLRNALSAMLDMEGAPLGPRERELVEELHEAKRRLSYHVTARLQDAKDIERNLVQYMRSRISGPPTPFWQRPVLCWAMRKLIGPTFA